MMPFYFVHFLLTSHSIAATLPEGIMADHWFPFFRFQNLEEITVVLLQCVLHLIQYYRVILVFYDSLDFQSVFWYQNRLGFELVGCETSELGDDHQILRNQCSPASSNPNM